MLRTNFSWRTVFWIAWLCGSVFLTAGLFQGLIDAFRNPGPEFYRLVRSGLPLFAVAQASYIWFRRAWLWRYEPVVVAGVCCGALLFYRLQSTLLLGALFLASYALGALLLDRFGLRPGPVESSVPVSAALGIAIFGPILFVLGLMHLYYPWIFVCVLALPCVLFYRHWIGLIRSVRQMVRGWQACFEMRSPLAGMALVYLSSAAFVSCVLIITPSLAFDPIHMHLREAFFYADHHELALVPGLTYSYFPGSYEVLLTMMAAIGGQPAAQSVSALFFLMAGLLAFRFAREAGASPGAALVGTAAAVTVPAILFTASVSKNDFMLVLFEVAALECFLYWRRTRNFAWIFMAAFLVASAFCVKHVALFGAVPLIGLCLFAAWWQAARTRAAVTLILVLALFGTYWQMRTFLLTGNPLYPESATRATPVSGLPDKPTNLVTGLVERYATVLWRVQFDGQFAFAGPLRSPLGIFLLVFLPVWIVWRQPQPSSTTQVLVAFAGVYLVYWIHTSPVLRYSLPATVLLLSLTGARVAGYFDDSSLAVRASLLGALWYALTFGMLSAAIISLNGPQLRWLSRRSSDQGYLREAMSTYCASEFLAGAATKSDRVLGLDYIADIYSPGSIRITGFLSHDGKITPEFMDQLRHSPYEWIVTPRSAVPDLNGNVANLHLHQAYLDGHFAVFHVDR